MASRGLDRPVFTRFENLDFILTLADQPQGDRLHPTGRKTVTDLFPEERGQVEADQVIEHRARLLGIDQVAGDPARMGHGLVDRGFGDLMKSDPFDNRLFGIFIDSESFQQVPGDRFPFAVEVGCEDQFVAVGRFFLESADVPGAFRKDMVFRIEIVFRIDRPLLARQGSDMAVGRKDFVPLAKKLLDGFGFCGRLDDNQCFCHLLLGCWHPDKAGPTQTKKGCGSAQP